MVSLAQIVGFITSLPRIAVRRRQLHLARDNEWYDCYDIPRSYRIRLQLSRWVFGNSRAYGRGLKLLLENLTPAQRQEFMRHGSFCVVGGQTGRRYRICRGRQMNVQQLDGKNLRACLWCFYPVGGLVDGDVMLAQKLALELFENEALETANRML